MYSWRARVRQVSGSGVFTQEQSPYGDVVNTITGKQKHFIKMFDLGILH